MDSRRLICKSE